MLEQTFHIEDEAAEKFQRDLFVLRKKCRNEECDKPVEVFTPNWVWKPPGPPPFGFKSGQICMILPPCL